jgi:hypothetical protein
VLEKHKPTDDEDVLMIFVGDQQAPTFTQAVRKSALRPMAFGFVYTPGTDRTNHKAVEETAAAVGIPCFRIDNNTFQDVYAIPRTIRALVAATPVGVTTQQVQRKRVTLAETIAQTDLLVKPAWAS